LSGWINSFNLSVSTIPVYSEPGLPDGLFSNQKSQFLVNFGGSSNGKSWYILRPFGLFYSHLKYFMASWYILWSLGIFLPVLVFCTKKNLGTLLTVYTKAFSVDDDKAILDPHEDNS
jgi:hypothetical protein